MNSDRSKWVDISRGIGIIFVVLGHSGNPFLHKNIYLFHMPLFFLISGYLFKEKTTARELKQWILKKHIHLLVPYCSFGVLITLLLFISNMSVKGAIKNLIKLIYGGDVLINYFGVFWFITCLLLTQIIFSLLNFFIKNKQIIFFLLFFSYCISNILSLEFLQKKISFFWSIDTVFIAIIYYSFGFYGQNVIKTILSKKNYKFIIISLSIFIVISINFFNFSFQLDLKKNIHSPIFLDILLPVILSMTLFILSSLLEKTIFEKIFSYIGKFSMTIMYLHIPVNLLLKNFIDINSSFLYLLFGTLLPILFELLISKNSRFNFLFTAT